MQQANMRMTSVLGHMMELDFAEPYRCVRARACALVYWCVREPPWGACVCMRVSVRGCAG